MQFRAITHDFKPVEVRGNIVLAKCDCCRVPRWAVFVTTRNDRTFWYHGYDRVEAERTFEFLARRQAQQAQIQ